MGTNPYLTQTTNQAIVTFSQDEAYWFDANADGSYTAQFGAPQTLVHDTARDLFVFTDTDGTVYEFYDSATADHPLGAFDQSVAPSGAVTQATWSGGQIATIQYMLSASLHPLPNSSYISIGAAGRTRAGWKASQSGTTTGSGSAQWNNVSLVTYRYYDGLTDTANGSLGDLEYGRLPELDTVDSSGQWTADDTYYYRYYTDGDRVHCLELALTPQEFQNVENPTDEGGLKRARSDRASDTQLIPYSSAYYNYNTDRQVISATVGGIYTYTYAYSSGTLVDGYNNWQTETIETRPDLSTYTVFANYIGESIATDPKDSSNNHWYTYTLYGTNSYDAAQPVLEAQPSAVGSCTFDGTNLSVTLNPTSGVLDEYDYYGPGGITEASPTTPLAGANTPPRPATPSATCNLRRCSTATTSSRHRPPTRSIPVRIMPTPDRLTAIRRRFTPRPRQRPTAWPTIPPTAQSTTTYNYTFYTNTLQPQEIDTTEPIVTGAQNGSGVAATTADYYDATGNPTWSRDGRGVLTAYGYDPITGAVTEEIDDVNTANPGGNPGVSALPVTSGVPWATASGPDLGQNLVTDYQYNLAGRLSQVMGPAHLAVVNGPPRPTCERPRCTPIASRSKRAMARASAASTWADSRPRSTATIRTRSGRPPAAPRKSAGFWTAFTPVGPLSIEQYDRDGNLVGEASMTLASVDLGGGGASGFIPSGSPTPP